MNYLIQAIKDKRNAILIGEIGALLHDIGKCDPRFIKKNSEGGGDDFKHANIDAFLNNKLVQQIKDKKFKIDFTEDKTTDVYTLIKEHHKSENELVKLLQSCDRLDSADDKGIVRKPQPIAKTDINSPFGHLKETIDLTCLQNRLDALSDNLTGLFENYISNSVSLTCFRKSIVTNLETTFTHALGETRIPSNDVTLWDHSHSTASLFKSILCSLALGKNPDAQKLQWQILGFCWDGTGFINKGKKIADILKRNEIIEEIKNKLKNKFEDEIPIGNRIYEDTNGIYFTFPEFEKELLVQLAKECAKIGLNLIREETDNEVWPFFTLSNPSRTITIIANELKFASDKRKITKISPTLFLDGKPEVVENNLELPISKDEASICPVCQFRAKPVDLESCEICKTRREGRVSSWLSDSESTIWMDEVADKNNRVALLTLSFNLDRWLDGTMVGTIYSQSFEQWLNGVKEKKVNNIKVLKTTVQLITEASIAETLSPDKETIYKLLEIVVDNSDKDKSTKILNTFFQDVDISKKQYDVHIQNIKERLGERPFNKENLATYLFTQNASPARIYRIWKETEEFFDFHVRKIKDAVYSTTRKRVKFSFDTSNPNLKPNTTYLIKSLSQ